MGASYESYASYASYESYASYALSIENKYVLFF